MKIKTQQTIAIIAFGIAIVFIAGFVVVTTQRVNQLNTQQDLANKIENEANDLSYLSAEYVLYSEQPAGRRMEIKRFGINLRSLNSRRRNAVTADNCR